MPLLRMLFFGVPRFQMEGRSIQLAERKAAALLSYLAVTGSAYSRDFLAAFFWPDNANGRNRLRHALWLIRSTLGDSWLAVSREQVGLAADASLWVDVCRFRQLLTNVRSHPHRDDLLCPTCQAALEECATLYEADFLTGFSLRDSPEFDEWHYFQAEDLRRDMAAVCEQLITECHHQGETEAAVSYARRWLTLDPLHEPAHRQLMELYAAAHQPAAALRQYETAKRFLLDELGVYPQVETRQLAETIRKSPQAKPVSMSQPIPGPDFLSPVDLPPQAPAVFVGRERQLATLAVTLESALSGQGQIQFVIGGAGRGKTALVQEFCRQAQLAHQNLLVVAGHCNAHTGPGDPYLPFRELLSELTGEVEAKWAGGRMSGQQALDLWQAMAITLPALLAHGPVLIGSLLNGQSLQARATTFAPNSAPWFHQLDYLVSESRPPSLTQDQLCSQVIAFLQSVAVRRPLLLLIEDLHWVDTASNDLLFHLSREIGHVPVLIVGTYRPEEIISDREEVRHPLSGMVSELKRQHGDIWLDLGATSELEGREFIDAYLDTQANILDAKFRQALFQHTGGHALFTVELLRAMQEHGDIKQDERGRWMASPVIQWEQLPARVEGVIKQRIGRLDEELQAVLRCASVEGELFVAEVIAHVQKTEARQLVRRLSQEVDQQHRLVSSQYLLTLGSRRLSHYRFRHQLFQHYLYHSLDEMEQAYLHEDVGLALETLYGDQRELVAEQLAHHFERAGLMERAIEYLLLSGKKAVRKSANVEAINHLGHGLRLLDTIPASATRDEYELSLQVAMGVPLQATRGLGSDEVAQSYSRARQLADLMGTTPQRFPALWGMWLYYVVRAQHQTALELGDRLLNIAQDAKDPDLLLLAHRAMGTSMFWRGEFDRAIYHLCQVIDAYEIDRHRWMASTYGASDIKVHCLAYGALAVAWTGYVDQAVAMSREALALAEILEHPYSLAMASLFAAWLHSSLQDGPAALALADSTVRISGESGFPFWLSCGTAVLGWASAGKEGFDQSLSQLEAGLAAYRQTGAEVFRPYLLGLYAQTLDKAGRSEEALAVLADALQTTCESGEHSWDAELLRLKGVILLAEYPAQAESCLLQSMELAARQGAKLLQLRAALDLCRCWQRQGKGAMARQELGQLYSWFSEGFDSVDLCQARTLLEALAC